MTLPSPTLFQRIQRSSLVMRIFVGMLAGIALALVAPDAALAVGLLGKLFIAALKAVAPVLVLVLVCASIANHKAGQRTHIRPILALYLLGTFAAAVVAVAASFAFPSTLVLDAPASGNAPPGGIGDVLNGLLFSVASNPVKALLEANFIGILAWAVGLGLALRRAREVLRPGSLAIVICDERSLTAQVEQHLAMLSRHCDLLLMPVSDPLDHALPAAGLLRFAQRSAQLELDTLDANLRQAYRQQAEARIERWELMAQKLRVLLMPLSTQSDMIEQLREYLNAQRPRSAS